MANYYILPLTNEKAHYQFSVDLEGETFYFNIDWNDRAEQWYFDMLDSSKDEILGGVPLVLNTQFLELTSSADKPNGSLFLYNFSDENTEATRTNLGEDVKLVYYGDS